MWTFDEAMRRAAAVAEAAERAGLTVTIHADSPPVKFYHRAGAAPPTRAVRAWIKAGNETIWETVPDANRRSEAFPCPRLLPAVPVTPEGSA